MSEIRIKLEPLSRESFAAFGDVIDIEGAKHFPINAGTIERYHDLADIDVGVESGGRAIVSIMTCNQTSELPYQIKVMERHPLGSQAFVPMKPIPMAIAVALPGDNPDFSQIRGFISNGTQGVNFKPGVWHMPLISTCLNQQYLIVDRGGAGDNCDEIEIKNQVIVVYL
jgi:ureidoglycolate lyase